MALYRSPEYNSGLRLSLSKFAMAKKFVDLGDYSNAFIPGNSITHNGKKKNLKARPKLKRSDSYSRECGRETKYVIDYLELVLFTYNPLQYLGFEEQQTVIQ